MSRRLVKQSGEYVQSFASEDGKNYRIETQEMDPVIEHVKFLDEKVNGAPRPGNTNNMHYIGSPPWTVVIDWCKNNGYSIEQFARNEDRCSDKFKKWFLNNRDMSKFRPQQRKGSTILMPGGVG